MEWEGLKNGMVIDLRRAAVFVSVGGAIRSIGFIFQNQKVFSGLNVYWEMTMMFLSKCKLCISGFMGRRKSTE